MDGQPNEQPPQQQNQPPQQQPQQPPQQQPQSRPPVHVTTQDNTAVLDAIGSIPEKIGDVFKETFQAYAPKPPEPPQQQQQQQQPPQQQPPQQPPTPEQPTAPKIGRFAAWWHGVSQ